MVKDLRELDTKARLIRDRAAAALEDAATKDPYERRPPAKRDRTRAAPLERLVAQSTHLAAQIAGRWLCARCKTTPDARGLRPWLMTTCTPLQRAGWGECLAPPPEEPAAPDGSRSGGLRIGTQHLDRSHHLLHFPDVGIAGVWACTRCGAYATTAARGLAGECSGTLLRFGRSALAALRKGRYPGGSAAAVAFNEGRKASVTLETPRLGKAPSRLLARAKAKAGKREGPAAPEGEPPRKRVRLVGKQPARRGADL